MEEFQYVECLASDDEENSERQPFLFFGDSWFGSVKCQEQKLIQKEIVC